jgi:hypothetical protein
LLALAATVALVPGGSGHRDRPWDLTASLQAMVALVGLGYAIREATKARPDAAGDRARPAGRSRRVLDVRTPRAGA